MGHWGLDEVQEGLCSLYFEPQSSAFELDLGPEDVLV